MESKHKILFVDDDEFIRKIYTDRLEASGFELRTANDASEAKKLIEQEQFDLICLDYALAGQSGLDILKWIRGDKQNTVTPIFIFSASGQEHDIEEFMKAGATEYIQKDHVVPTELVNKIKAAIKTKNE